MQANLIIIPSNWIALLAVSEKDHQTRKRDLLFAIIVCAYQAGDSSIIFFISYAVMEHIVTLLHYNINILNA